MRRLAQLLSRLPPPLLYAVPLALGLRMNEVHAQGLVPESLAAPARVVGIVLIALAGVLALSAIGLFVRRRTTIVPHRRSRALVTGGPYRHTRNPMYVGLTSAFLGTCLLTNVLWPVVFLALPLLYLHAITIPREEELLREAFGAEYDAYASRVRRWL